MKDIRIFLTIVITFLTLITLIHESPVRTIIRIVDGDTIVLNGKERVRLIGVDWLRFNILRKPFRRF